jgi:hypothetical protein
MQKGFSSRTLSKRVAQHSRNALFSLIFVLCGGPVQEPVR